MAATDRAGQARTGARHLVDALLAQGVERVFCVPGESYLSVLDALYDVRDQIELIVCRNETGASAMAEAHGKLTGRPGICMVTRGPGAAQAMIGVHTARQDSTPMILFIGQVARADRGREAFQEVDHPAAFAPWAKWAGEIDDPGRVPECVSRAFATALQGRMGPVALALPEDMLDARAEAEPAPTIAPARSGLDPDFLEALRGRLRATERPLAILGGSGWSAQARGQVRAFLEAHDMPGVCVFRRKDLLDNSAPCFAGDLGFGLNPKLAERVRDADLLLAIGTRLGDVATQGYTLLTRADAAQKLVHIHPGAEEIGRVWPPALAAIAAPPAAAAGLAGLKPERRFTAWRSAARADFEAFTAPIGAAGAVNLAEAFAALSAALPADAIVCNGAGNYAAWLHRFYRHRGFPTQIAPTSGAMGYALPAAIAAKRAFPEREVFAVAGDGCFLMTAQELAVAAAYDVRVRIIVVDNSAYGTIRMHQERAFPARVSGTDLANPDFAALARAFGVSASVVERTEDFMPAVAGARTAPGPALIHVRTDIEDIAPGVTISGLRGR